MPFERLFADAKEIKIKWSEPCLLTDIEHNKACQNKHCLYKLVGQYNDNFKLFYIGKSETKCVWRRLKEDDHKRKQATIQEAHKHHKLLVSVGILTVETDVQTLRKIERLLIFAHGGNIDFKRFINQKHVFTHGVLSNYTIQNLGFKRDSMYREVGVGMYYRK